MVNLEPDNEEPQQELSDVNDLTDTQHDMTEVLKVLEVIASEKASYQSEIANKKGIENGKVGQSLHKLKDKGIVEILKPSLGYMDDQRLLD